MEQELNNIGNEAEDGYNSRKLLEDLVKQGVIQEQVLKDYNIG